MSLVHEVRKTYSADGFTDEQNFVLLLKTALKTDEVRILGLLYSHKTLEELVSRLEEYEVARRRFFFENEGAKMRHAVHPPNGGQEVRFGNERVLSGDTA